MIIWLFSLSVAQNKEKVVDTATTDNKIVVIAQKHKKNHINNVIGPYWQYQ